MRAIVKKINLTKLSLLLLMAAGFFVTTIPVRAADVTNDSLGISASTSSYVSNVVRGNNIYVHFVLHSDSSDNIGAIVTLCSTPSAANDDHVIVHSHNGADGSGASGNNTYVFNYTSDGAIDSYYSYIEGYVTLPAGFSTSRHSLEIYAYFHWQDYNGNDRIDSVQAQTNGAGNTNPPVGIYQGKLLTCAVFSAVPTMYEPSTYWQGGHNSNNIRFDFETSSNAPANNDTLLFLSGTTVIQRIVISSAVTNGTLYAGVLNYSPAANGGLGGFTSVSSDPDTTGATSFTFTEPALATRAAFVNGSTYSVKFAHCESGGAVSARATYSNFVYDNSAPAPTLGYPIATFQGGHDDDTIRVRITLPEKAKANSVTLEFRNGGTAAQQIIFSNVGVGSHSARLAYDSSVNPSFGVVPASQLNSDSILVINSQTDNSDLVDGTTYTVRVYYTDQAGNVSPNFDFASFVYDVSTTAPTLSSPVPNANLTATSQTFQWNNSELYTVDTLFIEKISGTDANSPHYLAITPGDPLMNMSNPKSLTINLGGLNSTGSYTVGPSEGLGLVSGVTYKWYFKSVDLVPSNPVAISTNRQFTIATGNVLAVTANGLNTSINRSISNRPVLKLTGSTTSGGAVDLTQLVVNYSGNALNAEIVSIDLWKSSVSTFAVGTSTHLASTAYNGASSTFNGWGSGAAHFTTAVEYLYLTITTSASATTGHHLTVTVPSTASFSFAAGGDQASGTFPMSTSTVALPVELNRLSADSRDGIVYLHWVTESEINNAGFDVLRRLSGDGDFLPVATYSQNADLHSKSENGTSATPNEYDFIDNTVTPGTSYEYRLRSVDLDGIAQELALTVNVTASELPQQFALEQAYPNPFNSSTNVRFDVPFASNLRVTIYDVNGREIKRLVDGQVDAGNHVIMWNGRSSNGTKVASGAYFVRLTSGKFNTTRKIVLLQ